MTIRIVSLVAIAAVLAGATAALAETGGHHGFFDRQDTNHDGYIDKSEATADMLARFDAMDTDRDGRLSRDEVRGAIRARWQDRADAFRQRRMDRLDANKDGKLSWDEMSARAKTRFDELDTNHDGFIDDGEMAQARADGWHHRHHDDGATKAQ